MKMLKTILFPGIFFYNFYPTPPFLRNVIYEWVLMVWVDKAQKTKACKIIVS